MPRSTKAPVLEQNSRGVYEIKWTEGRRTRRKSTRATTLAAAAAFLETWNRQTSSLVSDTKCSNIAEILDGYWTEWANDTVSAATTHSHIKLLRQGLGSLSLSDLTPIDLKSYCSKRRKGLLGVRPVGDATLRRELAIFQAAVNHAVKARRIPAALAPSITLPPASGPRERYLDLDEIDRLLKTASTMRDDARLSRIERFLALALFTGARKEAILKLTWDRVDVAKRLIDYRDPTLKATKKRRATVPIADALLPVLERAYAERRGNFVLDTTGPIRSVFERCVAKAELEDVTPHTLRHTWATHASMNGVALTEVARVLGNTLAVCERVYAKYQPGYLRAAVNQAYGDRSFTIEERAAP